MAEGRRDRGHFGGRNVSRATMWRRQCLRSQDVAGGSRDRGCMVEAVCKEPGCG